MNDGFHVDAFQCFGSRKKSREESKKMQEEFVNKLSTDAPCVVSEKLAISNHVGGVKHSLSNIRYTPGPLSRGD